jgi:hypothetical protein
MAIVCCQFKPSALKAERGWVVTQEGIRATTKCSVYIEKMITRSLLASIDRI